MDELKMLNISSQRLGELKLIVWLGEPFTKDVRLTRGGRSRKTRQSIVIPLAILLINPD